MKDVGILFLQANSSLLKIEQNKRLETGGDSEYESFWSYIQSSKKYKTGHYNALPGSDWIFQASEILKKSGLKMQ